MLSKYMDEPGHMIWTYYWFGRYYEVWGDPIIAVCNSEGKLRWFVMFRDDSCYLFGDIPLNWVTEWFVNYPEMLP